MRDVAIALRMTGFQLKSMRRNSRSLVFTVILPIGLFLLFASAFTKHGGDATKFQGGQLSTKAYYLGGIIAYAMVQAAYSSLMISLVTQRETGLLKRFRATPMPPWTFLSAQIVRAVAIVALEVAALLLVGRFGYDIHVSATAGAEIALYAALGTFALCSLGIALTSLAKTADSASTLGPFSALMLSFISGVFIPTDQLPHALVSIGKVFPLSHLAEGLQAALIHGHVHLKGENVAVLALWGLGGLIFAQRTFRWEPQGAGT